MTSSQAATDGAAAPRHLLWIDGVGAYLVCLGDEVSIGGPRFDGNAADVSLLANLSRRHAAVVRSGEGYYLKTQAAARVADRTVDERIDLADGYEIALGESVRLKFRQPSVLSATAVLEFLSDHRPTQSVDGVLLMESNLLLGPGTGNHVVCPDWPDQVLLYRHADAFRCKARSDVLVNGRLSPAGGPIEPGDVVSGGDFRFRLEDVTES